MNQYILNLMNLCIFKSNPQDLPSGSYWLKVSIAFLLAVQTLSFLKSGTISNLIPSVFYLAIVAGILYLILKAKKITQRFSQTISAIFGSQAILTLLLLILQLFIATPRVAEEGQTIQQIMELYPQYFMILGFIGIWKFIIEAHILRHALSTSFGGGLLWAFALSSISLVAFLFFPV